MIRIPNEGKAIIEQILALDERKKSYSAGLIRIIVLDPSRKVKYLSNVV